MSCKECIPMVVHSRCTQEGINESDVRSVLESLQSKLDEAETNLQRCGKSLESMYCAFDVEEVITETGGSDRMDLYPRLAPSAAAWSGVFNKTLSNQESDLTHAERLAVKMINYIVYTECVYANLVNQLCYVLANACCPSGLRRLHCETDIKSIARSVDLKYKVMFLTQNLPDVESSSPSITNACNINLRNMIAHGSFAGNQPPGSRLSRQKPKHRNMSEPVYVRGGYKEGWKWKKNPVDLDAEYDKMHHATLIWHNALWCYWDLKFGSQKCSH